MVWAYPETYSPICDQESFGFFVFAQGTDVASELGMAERTLIALIAVAGVGALSGLGSGASDTIAGGVQVAPHRSARAPMDALPIGSTSSAASVNTVTKAGRAAARGVDLSPNSLRVHGLDFAAPSTGRMSELAPSILERVHDLPIFMVEGKGRSGKNATVWRGEGREGTPVALRIPMGTRFHVGEEHGARNFTVLSAVLNLIDEDVSRFSPLQRYSGAKLQGLAWVKQDEGYSLAHVMEWIEGTTLEEAKRRVSEGLLPLEGDKPIMQFHIDSANELARRLGRDSVHLDDPHDGNLLITDDGVRLIDNGLRIEDDALGKSSIEALAYHMQRLL